MKEKIYKLGEKVYVCGDNLERITRYYVGVDKNPHEDGQFICSLFPKDHPLFLEYIAHWETVSKVK